MSELGATGSPAGSWVNLTVFAGAQFWMMLFLVCAGRRLPKSGPAVVGLALLWLYAALLLVAAMSLPVISSAGRRNRLCRISFIWPLAFRLMSLDCAALHWSRCICGRQVNGRFLEAWRLHCFWPVAGC